MQRLESLAYDLRDESARVDRVDRCIQRGDSRESRCMRKRKPYCAGVQVVLSGGSIARERREVERRRVFATAVGS